MSIEGRRNRFLPLLEWRWSAEGIGLIHAVYGLVVGAAAGACFWLVCKPLVIPGVLAGFVFVLGLQVRQETTFLDVQIEAFFTPRVLSPFVDESPKAHFPLDPEEYRL